MNNNDTAERIYNANLKGVIRRGRQKSRLVDLGEKDARELRIPGEQQLDSAEGSSAS